MREVTIGLKREQTLVSSPTSEDTIVDSTWASSSLRHFSTTSSSTEHPNTQFHGFQFEDLVCAVMLFKIGYLLTEYDLTLDWIFKFFIIFSSSWTTWLHLFHDTEWLEHSLKDNPSLYHWFRCIRIILFVLMVQCVPSLFFSVNPSWTTFLGLLVFGRLIVTGSKVIISIRSIHHRPVIVRGIFHLLISAVYIATIFMSTKSQRDILWIISLILDQVLLMIFLTVERVYTYKRMNDGNDLYLNNKKNKMKYMAKLILGVSVYDLCIRRGGLTEYSSALSADIPSLGYTALAFCCIFCMEKLIDHMNELMSSSSNPTSSLQLGIFKNSPIASEPSVLNHIMKIGFGIVFSLIIMTSSILPTYLSQAYNESSIEFKILKNLDSQNNSFSKYEPVIVLTNYQPGMISDTDSLNTDINSTGIILENQKIKRDVSDSSLSTNTTVSKSYQQSSKNLFAYYQSTIVAGNTFSLTIDPNLPIEKLFSISVTSLIFLTTIMTIQFEQLRQKNSIIIITSRITISSLILVFGFVNCFTTCFTFICQMTLFLVQFIFELIWS